jgi:hypothetical protein
MILDYKKVLKVKISDKCVNDRCLKDDLCHNCNEIYSLLIEVDK